MLDRSIKRRLLNQAQRMAPHDTGNLRFNAIRGRKWSNKNNFVINYSSQDAYYVEYLEEGQYAGGVKGKPNLNKGFIFDTVGALERMLIGHFEKGKKINKSSFNKSESKTNDRREYIHNKSLELYKQMREENNNGN